MTLGDGIFFKNGTNRVVVVYLDDDWAESIANKRSIIGYMTYVCGDLVTWQS